MSLDIRVENGFFGKNLYIKNLETLYEEKKNITGMISLADEYEEKVCSYEVVAALITELMKTGRRIEKEGKDISGIILNPEYIYVEETGENNRTNIEILFFDENSNVSFDDEILKLAEFLIWHVDHKSDKALNLAYDFYNQVIRKNYVFDRLIEL